jgi:hypothetical protein
MHIHIVIADGMSIHLGSTIKEMGPPHPLDV